VFDGIPEHPVKPIVEPSQLSLLPYCVPAFVPRSCVASGSLKGGAVALFDTEFANGEFTEKKKIMVNERLAEIGLTDPKRVKRCASISWYRVLIFYFPEIKHFDF
jgi:hypothetical protein